MRSAIFSLAAFAGAIQATTIHTQAPKSSSYKSFTTYYGGYGGSHSNAKSYDYEKEVSEREDEIEQIDDKIWSQHAQIVSLQATLAALENWLSSVDVTTSEIDANAVAQSDQDTEITTLKQQCKDLLDLANELTTQVALLTALVDMVPDQTNNFARLDALDAQTTSLESSLTAVEAGIVTASTNQSTVTADVMTLDANIAAIDLTDITTAVGDLESLVESQYPIEDTYRVNPVAISFDAMTSTGVIGQVCSGTDETIEIRSNGRLDHQGGGYVKTIKLVDADNPTTVFAEETYSDSSPLDDRSFNLFYKGSFPALTNLGVYVEQDTTSPVASIDANHFQLTTKRYGAAYNLITSPATLCV